MKNQQWYQSYESSLTPPSWVLVVHLRMIHTLAMFSFFESIGQKCKMSL